MAESAGEQNGRRPSLRRAVGVMALSLFLSSSVWLFWSTAEEPEPPSNVADIMQVEGTLEVVEPDRLVLKPFEEQDGSDRLEFSIPDKYRENFEMAHLRSHSAVGIPIRIHYLDREDGLVAVYKTDPPTNEAG